MELSTKSDSSLEFIATDCRDAIAADPENPKAEFYLATMRAIRHEQTRRYRLRQSRREIFRGSRYDLPMRSRWMFRANRDDRYTLQFIHFLTQQHSILSK